jgi:hypothetical protein
MASDLTERVKHIMDHTHGRLSRSELEALDILGVELKSLKKEEKPMKKRIEAKVAKKKVVRRHGFGSGVSNFDALGHTLKKGVVSESYLKKHPTCMILCIDGVAKRMEPTNESVGGHGVLAPVYRVSKKD